MKRLRAARRLRYRRAMTTTPTFRDAVRGFKRQLLEAQLQQSAGNRTHAARALGLQRTYLLRLIRDLGITVPPRRGRTREVGE
ncbi:MAG TPA: helix-turn-helix domain-containing protein [Candidatus Limnocylindria bacterium]|nr:helix-turn-helix domain-containing protein [Candidatus Limnocylindria bacterium]